MPQRHPSRHRARQDDRRLCEAQLRYAVDQRLQLAHRGDGRLHDHARVAGHPMAFGEFGDFLQGLVGLLIAMAGQAQFHHALDRQADLLQVDLGRVAADHAAGLKLGHPLGHCRGREIDLARQLRVRGPPVFQQGGEEHAVVLVHGDSC